MKFIFLTGLSGSGKTTSLRYLEDLGCPYVDNLPPAMVMRFIELCTQFLQQNSTVVIAVDIRSGDLFDAHAVRNLIAGARTIGTDMRVLFLEAPDETLLNRFKETRREHPLLSQAGSLPKAIAMERERLQPLREMADIIVSTENMRPKGLKQRLSEILELQEAEEGQRIQVQIESFGFKRGLPRDADLVWDVRFLPNPFYIDDIRFQTGLQSGVREYVLDAPITQAFLGTVMPQMELLLPHYEKEGKRQLVIGIGCTGGAHRSVAIAEALGERIRAIGYNTHVRHRDIELEKENWKHI